MNQLLAVMALLLLFVAVIVIVEGIAMIRKPVARADRRNSTAFFIWGILFFIAGIFLINLNGGMIVTLNIIKEIAIILTLS